MNTCYCKLVLLNEDEWKKYVNEVLDTRGSKSNEEVLEEICTFDFKFDTILVKNIEKGIDK